MQDKSKGFYTMEDLLLPHFKLKDSEEALLQAGKKPWWKFWM